MIVFVSCWVCDKTRIKTSYNGAIEQLPKAKTKYKLRTVRVKSKVSLIDAVTRQGSVVSDKDGLGRERSLGADLLPTGLAHLRDATVVAALKLRFQYALSRPLWPTTGPNRFENGGKVPRTQLFIYDKLGKYF